MVLSKTGGTYRVAIGRELIEAQLRGRLKNGPRRALVGDTVRTCEHSDGSVTIEEITPRTSVLKRRTPGKRRGTRAVAANLDQVVVVGAARDPRWDQRLIDRFVVVAEANELPATVVVNKADLADDAPELARPYRDAGYPTLITSVPKSLGLNDLAARLRDHVSLFTGPTGVGKSSLLNAVQPGLDLRTGTVSPRSRAGRHTTVAAEMYMLDGGGFVVDTPGLRDIRLWGIDPIEVANAFPEFGPFVDECRFDDCRHTAEPGCSITAAAEAGQIDMGRLESYRSLLQEAIDAGRQWASKGTG